MGFKNQSGQALIETIMTVFFFAGLFIALQVIVDQHKQRSQKYKLTREVKYEIQTTIKK
jgi:hypothetical protein